MVIGIKRLPLQSEIINFICGYIEDNHLEQGDKLPSQAQLTQMMSISQTSLREAMKTLEAKHILEVKNGKGIYVKEKHLLGPQLEFTREKELFLELLDARKYLEREILRLVVLHATEEDLDQLEALIAVIMDKYRRGEPQNKEDREFHYLIYRCSHNRIMLRLIQSISDLLDKMWEFPLGMEDPFTETMPLHYDLYLSLRARDTKKAQEINETILNQVIRDMAAGT